MSSGSSPWDKPGWRDVGHRLQTNAIPISAPTAVNPATQSAILDRRGRDAQQWNPERRPLEPQPSLMTEPHGESTYPNGSYDRHTPSSGGGYGPQQLKSTSPHHPPPEAWQSLRHDDHRRSTTITADAPLTLHIPKSQGTYKTAAPADPLLHRLDQHIQCCFHPSVC